MKHKPFLLSCLLGLTLLSGCNKVKEQQASTDNATVTQQAADTTTPSQQDYGYEGYEQQAAGNEYSQPRSSGTDELEVSKYSEPSPYMSGAIATYVVITSLSNDITLKTILVNRGNCGVEFPRSSPNLKYGAQYRVYVKASCRPEQIREVEVGTARDTYTFNF